MITPPSPLTHRAHAAEDQVAQLLVAVEAEASVEQLMVHLIYCDSAEALGIDSAGYDFRKEVTEG